MSHQGYFRVAAAIPAVNVADTEANAASIADMIKRCDADGVNVVVFPEMAVTAYTCADLFHSSVLIDSAADALASIAAETADTSVTAVIGAPVVVGTTLYNCAVAMSGGRIVAAVPKTYVPNYNEFYEKRWWASAPAAITTATVGHQPDVPFGTSLLLDCGAATVGIEICEDLWTPVPPSCHAALAGADVIVNLSASDDLTGKYDYLRSLIAQQSARCVAGYVYASAGYGESTTDLVFDGKAIVAENGSIIASSPRWSHDEKLAVADIDILALRRDRMHIGSFDDCARRENAAGGFMRVSAGIAPEPDVEQKLLRHIAPLPFVPAEGTSGHRERCDEITNIQAAGLERRLQATHCRNLVVGISGGLDSTLALLIAVKAFDSLGLDRTGITGVTMPGFGTTDRTHDNAVTLMRNLGVTMREISIVPAVEQHFKDIGHDPSNHDVTYENSQARQRTMLLMDIANQTGGMVLGTGDLSELALGWATYNGDHMSMYGVNAGVPKTLVRHLVKWLADDKALADCREVLLDIVDTPISPELIPAAADGTIKQKTEDLVGPYELHDFFLYYTLRYGFSPRRIYFMARKAFGEDYRSETIKKWITVFFRRFFAQQFKRSCLPDGPKIGSVCLSPRGDWRMPSDATSALWLKECESL